MSKEFVIDDFRFTDWKKEIEIEQFDKNEYLIRKISVPIEVFKKALKLLKLNIKKEKEEKNEN